MPRSLRTRIGSDQIWPIVSLMRENGTPVSVIAEGLTASGLAVRTANLWRIIRDIEGKNKKAA